MGRIGGAIAALLIVPLVVGATYQGVATSRERRQFLRPGGLVEGGGYQLHIYCVGEGSPTVVLEAAAGSISPAWGWLQADVARVTRVCSYDRSGLGWSEGDGRYLPSRVPTDLRDLLAHANEEGPFVVVGHELGAAFARLFAARYPADTAALVLVDDPAPGARSSPDAGAWPWLARAGILRATGGLSARATGLPGSAAGAMAAFLNRPDHLTQAAREVAGLSDVAAAARAVRIDPGIAVTSVAVGVHEQPVMLASPEDAAPVTRTIEATVAMLRDRRAPSPHEP